MNEQWCNLLVLHLIIIVVVVLHLSFSFIRSLTLVLAFVPLYNFILDKLNSSINEK